MEDDVCANDHGDLPDVHCKQTVQNKQDWQVPTNDETSVDKMSVAVTVIEVAATECIFETIEEAPVLSHLSMVKDNCAKKGNISIYQVSIIF